jgi:penicillin-binding protein 1C
VPLARISPHAVAALIAGEDARFRSHGGVDVLAALRALRDDLLSGRRVSGASTIAMQVARLVEPAPRTWSAKLREALRARQLERRLGKDAILEQYLNRAPWGGSLRGIEAASRWWFAVPAELLTPAQAATLVAMLPAPSTRSPTRDRAVLLDRRNRILGRMELEGDALARALAEPLPAAPHPFPWRAPHACDAALAEGAEPGSDGLIHLDLALAEQERVGAAIAAIGTPADGLAVVVVDLAGRERVHLGSSDWRRSAFDAVLAARAAGSTLKPFLYRRAFADGVVGTDSTVLDAPFDAGGWRPGNEDGRFLGSLPVGEALSRSRNPPAARTLAGIGLAAFADELGDAGLDVPVGGLDAALGTAAVSPLGLARAYASLARRAGAGESEALAVLAALRLRPLDARQLGEDAAWKTGTSAHRRDAWCVAMLADRVVVVWLGWRDGRPDPALRGRGAARGICASVAAALTRS